MSNETHSEVTYAEDSAPRSLILRVLVAALVVAFALCVLAWAIMELRERQLRPAHQFPERKLGAPHVVAAVRQAPFEPATPTPSLREEQQAALRGYRWVDRQHGVVQIPVARAIELLLAQSGARR